MKRVTSLDAFVSTMVEMENLGDCPEFYEIDTDTPHSLKDICILTRFAVLPEYRSSVLPLQIIRKLYKDALEDGHVKYSYMLTNTSLLTDFYVRFGFQKMGQREHPIYGSFARLHFNFESDTVGPLGTSTRRRVLAHRKKKEAKAYYSMDAV
jgi:GNAT superfamily N-acetyltransferase